MKLSDMIAIAAGRTYSLADSMVFYAMCDRYWPAIEKVLVAAKVTANGLSEYFDDDGANLYLRNLGKELAELEKEPG